MARLQIALRYGVRWQSRYSECMPAGLSWPQYMRRLRSLIVMMSVVCGVAYRYFACCARVETGRVGALCCSTDGQIGGCSGASSSVAWFV